MRMRPCMRMHAYTSCNGTGRWKFPIRKLNDLVALPKRPAAGRQRDQQKHRSRRTGPPPAGRAQSRPVGGGRQAQDQLSKEREKRP